MRNSSVWAGWQEPSYLNHHPQPSFSLAGSQSVEQNWALNLGTLILRCVVLVLMYVGVRVMKVTCIYWFFPKWPQLLGLLLSETWSLELQSGLAHGWQPTWMCSWSLGSPEKHLHPVMRTPGGKTGDRSDLGVLRIPGKYSYLSGMLCTVSIEVIGLESWTFAL